MRPPLISARPGNRSLRPPYGVLARCAGIAGLGSALLASGVPAAAASTDAAASSGRITVGASGDYADLTRAIGMPLATHVFGKLNGRTRVGVLTNIQSTVGWRTVAGASRGSSTYANIAHWADAVKATRRPVMVTFHHEPETHHSRRMGSSSDFIRAWRRVHDVFAARGVRNAEWVWNLSANSFRVSPGDPRYADRWYPGDSYVNHVGADPYNWVNCGSGRGGWRELEEIMSPAMRWAKAHGKRMVLPEFATNDDPRNAQRKAQWISDAHRYFIRNRSTFRAVFYFNNNHSRGCQWKIDGPPEVSAFRNMVRDAAFTTGG